MERETSTYRRSFKEILTGVKKVNVDHDTYDRIHALVEEANKITVGLKFSSATNPRGSAPSVSISTYDRVRGFLEDARNLADHAGLFFYEVRQLSDGTYGFRVDPKFRGRVTSKNLYRRGPNEEIQLIGKAFKIHRSQAIPPRKG
ncbi:hypothetical protein A3E69_00245 [Candidatus Roizmanbacteria bacterium RIFCSPHIGHO2_12_FULL_40_130]|nr:MAG: hypothetical protein A3E69_00245 [Candidatus Roizmanbacteria bacterium RIFCSPHIGHO2_12_FULL_40_130]OGK59778.1 MAG: hypothetical protein A3H84_03705 [Candidatus Roizmanbacteria bacterium RIFCSPLOWO2_02_FULL_40_13]